jgi:intracellular sulfur oxidation DsrE/DsrF family protein
MTRRFKVCNSSLNKTKDRAQQNAMTRRFNVCNSSLNKTKDLAEQNASTRRFKVCNSSLIKLKIEQNRMLVHVGLRCVTPL